MATVVSSPSARSARLGLRATPENEGLRDLFARKAPWDAK